MNLTTIDRVKSLLGVTLDASGDATLAQAVASISKQVQDGLRRKTTAASYTEVVRFYWGSSSFVLGAYPVTQIDSVRANSTPTFSGMEAWQANSDYVLDEECGVVTVLRDPPFFRDANGYPVGPSYFQVTYTGGMAADTAAFIAGFEDIAGAIDQQVAYLYQRRDNLGGNSKTSDGMTTFEGSYDLLPVLKERIAYHARGF